MLFNSFTFLFVFLPAVLIGFAAAVRFGAGRTALQISLFAASCIFIGASGLLSLGLLLISLGMNYVLLRWMAASEGERVRRLILILSVSANLSLIAVFKYADFIGQSFAAVSGLDIPRAGVELPLAISFYTFQQIALIIDSWRHKWECPPLAKLAVFVTFFPQLIAGPIVRFDEIEKDLDALGSIKSRNLAIGAGIIAVGLFKKAVIADSLAPAANLFFAGVEAGAEPALFEAWGGALAYTFQLYFDFSGYSDMAIGLAALFGIHIPTNFYSPYKATSIIEFWSRWHMTLSRFLRDYLYIPLGGNHDGITARWRNVLVTMLLGGLWHGASWNFVVWGGMHGILIAGNHLARRLGLTVTSWLGWALTFLAVVLCWVVFRTHDMSAAVRIYAGMAGLNGIVIPERLEALLGQALHWLPVIKFASSELLRVPTVAWILFAGMVALLFPNTEQLFRERQVSHLFIARNAIAFGMIAAVGFLGIHQAVEFVYFRF